MVGTRIYIISIHALARRATVFFLFMKENIDISIHALARRATVFFLFMKENIDISIHALARRATLNIVQRVRLVNISIHALARRATATPFLAPFSVFDFNPRSRKESDCDNIQHLLCIARFQSTLSQGERLSSSNSPRA